MVLEINVRIHIIKTFIFIFLTFFLDYRHFSTCIVYGIGDFLNGTMYD